MINCNPETVSTDYDTADRLYFEPLTFEDVLEVVHAEQASGPSPASSAARRPDTARPRAALEGRRRHRARYPARGDRPRRASRRFRPRCCTRPDCPRPSTALPSPSTTRKRWRTASVIRCWCARPTSWVDAAWRSSTTTTTCRIYIGRATEITPDHPVLVDRFLDDAIEIDVDALYDGIELYLGGVMEHIEEAGHPFGRLGLRAAADHAWASGTSTHSPFDLEALARAWACSACSTSSTRSPATSSTCSRRILAPPHRAVRVQGHRGAARRGGGAGDAGYDHRGTRAPTACLPRVGDGGTLAGRCTDRCQGSRAAVRSVPGESTRCLARRCARPAKSWASTRCSAPPLPSRRRACTARSRPRARAFVSFANRDKRAMVFPVKRLADLGWEIVATSGTADVLRRNGVPPTSRASTSIPTTALQTQYSESWPARSS